jgi:hypothetical protein
VWLAALLGLVDGCLSVADARLHCSVIQLLAPSVRRWICYSFMALVSLRNYGYPAQLLLTTFFALE